MKRLIPIAFILLSTACQPASSTMHQVSEKVPQVHDTLSPKTPEKDILSLVLKGLTMKELIVIYQGAAFIEEPMDLYGIDSENHGITVVEAGEKQFFVWKKYDSDTIYEAVILTPSIVLEDSIRVGAPLASYLHLHPNATLELDPISEEDEYAYAPGSFYSVEFVNRGDHKVAEYHEDYSLKKLLNPQAKIDRIRVSRR